MELMFFFSSRAPLPRNTFSNLLERDLLFVKAPENVFLLINSI